MSVRIYIEGGSQGSTKADCRQAFRSFFTKVVPAGSFKIIASGSRSAAYQDFCAALKKHADEYVMLLVDSEEPVAMGVWQHLDSRQGDHWPRPKLASDDHAHLMVQVMESWFLADRNTLAEYYGQGFLLGSLPGQPNIELISKQDVFNALQRASENTQKGRYHKTRHGFDLIERINPNLVRIASSHADRLMSVLQREANM